ncbi:hypothetical protein [Myroides odoratus]|uniref:hypothetical protein n=1 Tax=Myroides odoratus TaxID=256 RepID=UPI0039B02BD0
MKTLLLCVLFTCISFFCQAQIGVSSFYGKQGKTIVKFKNGTTEVGVLKGNALLFGYRYDDPYEFKFKNNGADDYRMISSNQVSSIVIHDKKNEEYFTEYFPIRMRDFGKKYTFSDKYYVDFYPLKNYKGVVYADVVVYESLNYGKSIGRYLTDYYYFPVGKTGYYFLFHGAYRRTNKESAQFMMLLDKDCKPFQEYMQENYLDTDNYKAGYNAAVEEFKGNKSQFLADRKAEGVNKKWAKIEYKSAEFFIYFQQILDKYSELCTHENH